jgi:hypothetical protein
LFEADHPLPFNFIASLSFCYRVRRKKMKHKVLIRPLLVAALVIVAVPLAASGQSYAQSYDIDRYDRANPRDVRAAINRLESSSARIESDLNYAPNRKVLGIFELRTTDSNAIAQVRDFRRAVRNLRDNSDNGRALNSSTDEARLVLESGVQLDHYLRLRTGSTRVDADLSDLRSSLHTLADAYDLNVPY